MASIGEPKKLREDVLPTQADVFNHFLYLREAKTLSGEWSKFTPLSTKLKPVLEDICALWDLTGIPHCLASREGERRLVSLLDKCKNLSKVPLVRREQVPAGNLQNLFDVALCSHKDMVTCTCKEGVKVPPTWRAFLTDQRGPRQLLGVLNSRTLTLRANNSKERQDSETRELLRYKVEELIRSDSENTNKSEKCESESEHGEHQPHNDTFIGVEEENTSDGNLANDDEHDSEWEDCESDVEISHSYNTMALKHFSMECERYDVPDRTAAKLGNALLKDLKLVTKGNTSKLICPSRLRED